MSSKSAFTISQTDQEYEVPKDSLNGWSEAHWRFNFTAVLGRTFIQFPILVPESVPKNDRHKTAISLLQQMIADIARAASELR